MLILYVAPVMTATQQRELFARNFVVPPVEYGYEDQVESGEGIATPRGSVLPHPERSEYAIVVRPRGVGVDAELAGWLTGLHGAAHGPIGIDGAAAGYHRMCVRLPAWWHACLLDSPSSPMPLSLLRRLAHSTIASG